MDEVFLYMLEAVSDGEIRHSTSDGRQYSSAVQSSAQEYPADPLMAYHRLLKLVHVFNHVCLCYKNGNRMCIQKINVIIQNI